MAGEPVKDPRVYFAAERTLLAWLRTGLALMGIGFAVARLGLFLREMQARQASAGSPHDTGVSLWSGVGLVVLGVVVEVTAAIHHVQTVKQLSSGRWEPGKVSGGAVALAGMIGVIGLAIAVYLVIR